MGSKGTALTEQRWLLCCWMDALPARAANEASWQRKGQKNNSGLDSSVKGKGQKRAA